jgi:hypothetical protein
VASLIAYSILIGLGLASGAVRLLVDKNEPELSRIMAEFNSLGVATICGLAAVGLTGYSFGWGGMIGPFCCALSNFIVRSWLEKKRLDPSTTEGFAEIVRPMAQLPKMLSASVDSSTAVSICRRADEPTPAQILSSMM